MSLHRPHRGRAAVTALLTAAVVLAGVQPATALPVNVVTLVAGPGVMTLPGGDGVRDAASVTFTSAADATISVSVRVGETVTKLTEVQVSAGSEATAQLQLGSWAVPGSHVVVISDVADPTVTAETSLIVGSGRVIGVTLAGTTPTQLYPYADGVRDSISTTVSAIDETGLLVPAVGSSRVVVGATQRSGSVVLGPNPTKVSLSVTGLPFGAGSFSVALRSPAGGSAVRSTPVAITSKSTAITAVGVSLSSTQVYPSKDGYRDVVSIKSTVAAKGVPFSFPITGRIQVKYGSTVVSSWSLSALGSRSVSWNGLNGGRVVPGNYTVVVSAKGPQGATYTKSTSVYVSGKKLVTQNKRVSYSAAAVLDDVFYDYSYSELGYCQEDWDGSITCFASDSTYYPDPTLPIALEVVGGVPVPTEVRAGYAYGRVQARMYSRVSYLAGGALWGYGSAGGSFIATEWSGGTTTAGWVPLAPKTARVDVVGGLGEYSSISMTSFIVDYSYKVLR